MTTEDRDPVDILAEEFADRLRRGEHPSVSDYASAHPQYAEQLREILPAVAQIELLKRFRQPLGSSALPERLGDFRIVRELGRGGMGVVFEAVQESLGRPVALKVLARHAQLDPKRRERFIREAQAAAKLHHTNIVPVFGVGEHDGWPYYVMQLIPGSGLHTIIHHWRIQRGLEATTPPTAATASDTQPPDNHETPPPPSARAVPQYGDWRFVAEVGRQAAEALHYAHKQGVLHRDIKPANLILDGETVWIADFGLAKMTNTDGLTATGDILGTLQYLPPECLVGRADVRSDIYGLGATLYELLTLASPYVAESPGRLIKLVADTDPRPPREINPHIPRDLETIVLKAMARRPNDRYPTARELADDLRAFLDDRPIKARRTSAAARAWRWCRRNPAVASLAASTMLALALAAAAGWIGYARAEARRLDAEREQHNAMLAKADAEKAKADAEKANAAAQQLARRLEENLQRSLEAFEKVFEAAGGSNPQNLVIPLPPMMFGRGPVGPDRWFGGPGGALLALSGGPERGPVSMGGPGGSTGSPNPQPGPGLSAAVSEATDKATILEAVLNFYDKFSEQNPPTPQLQFEAAKASRRVCEAHRWLKRPETSASAIVAFRRAVGLLEPLVKQFPHDEAMRSELILTYLAAPEEAFPYDRDQPFRHAVALAAGNPWLTGTVQFRIGLIQMACGEWPEAETAFQEALDTLLSVPPSQRPPHAPLDIACVRLHLAWAQGRQRGWTAARKVLDDSVRELAPLAPKIELRGPSAARGEPALTPAQQLMALTYFALYDVCEKLNDTAALESVRLRAGQFGLVINETGGRWRNPWGGGFGGPPFGWPLKKDGPPKKDKDGPKN
ncbi:MAG: serine/threonine-protein kinase [Gemmataceae bacterium]|nr:serine/threonine protein kinase [Gemmata sp.]MDW8196397.1 serine/threonine-protein kinase [Gemmataceae bacterium]